MDIKELVEMQRNYYMTLQTKDIDQRIKTIENIKIWILEHQNRIIEELKKD